MRTPSYLPNRQPDGTVKARVVIRGKSHGLGIYGSAESRSKYRQLLIAAGYEDPGDPIAVNPTEVHSIADLAAAWHQHALIAYAGRKQAWTYRCAITPLLRKFGHLPANEFTAKHLKTLRDHMISGDWQTEKEVAWRRKRGKPVGWCRSTVNARISSLRTIFSWAESEGMVPEGKTASLKTISKLMRGTAREAKKVLPVPEDHLSKTLPHLGDIVRSLIEFCLFTGCRPGEACRVRPAHVSQEPRVEIAPGFWLETRGTVWVYRPPEHKLAWLDMEKIILIGPKARTVLEPFLKRAPESFCFSPREAVKGWRLRQRLARKSRVQPSQASRAKDAPRRTPGVCYTVEAVNQVLARACKRAGVPKWSVGRLRHNAASRLASEFGEELARICLGHTTTATTARYILRDLQAGLDAIEKVG